MANGDLLRELRSIAQGDDPIPAKAFNRLVIAGLVQLYDQLDGLEGQITTRVDGLESDLCGYREQYRNEREKQTDMLTDVKRSLDALSGAVLEANKLRSNLAVQAGDFVRNHPRLTMAAVIVFLVVANFWFISDFRKVILVAIGLPPDLVTLMIPTTPTPFP
jgi:hypothetical protein